jgi:hypothetical protein
LITSNENFGNNVLKYLENSFNICSYLTIQYLCEHLTNIDIHYTFDDAKDIFNLFKYDINDIITKSGILETCPNAKNNNDKNKCIKKYLEKNKNTILNMTKPEILDLVCIDAKKDNVKNACVQKYLNNNPQVKLKI